MQLQPLTLAQFAATAQPCTPLTYQALIEENQGVAFPPITEFTEYATGFLIHTEGGKHFVHAWWYSPLGYATREAAVAALHKWFLEWV